MCKGKYVIEEFTEKKYHYNEEGEIDEVVNLIDCWDQILYVILFNRDIDIVDFFCGDINPEFYEYEEQFGLRRLEENVNRYFAINKIEKTKKSSYIDIIQKNLKKGLPVAMITMFDMLPNYDWYEEGIIGNHNGHSNMIVGYDEAALYVIDSPLVFVQERDKEWERNKSIHLIEKKYVEKALEVYCDLKTIQYIGNFIDEGFTEKLKRMEYNYWNGCNVGRKAIERYIEKIKKVSQEVIYTNLYEMHLVYARHQLLYLYLQKHFGKIEKWKDVIDSIQQCSEQWFVLKMLIQRQGTIVESEFVERTVLQLKRIMSYEDKFFNIVSDLLNDKLAE